MGGNTCKYVEEELIFVPALEGYDWITFSKEDRTITIINKVGEPNITTMETFTVTSALINHIEPIPSQTGTYSFIGKLRIKVCESMTINDLELGDQEIDNYELKKIKFTNPGHSVEPNDCGTMLFTITDKDDQSLGDWVTLIPPEENSES